LEQARTVAPTRSPLKEMFGMRFRWGLTAVLAAGLIVVGVMSSGGSAQAALAKMRKAVTTVTSSHLHLEFNAPLESDDKGKKDVADPNDPIGNTVNGLMSGSGPKSFDVWSKDNMFKVQAFGGIEIDSKDGFVTVLFGDKVFAKVAADKADMPKNLGDTLFKELSKATDEMKEKFNVKKVGTLRDGGRTLDTLEVTGIEDGGKHFRLLYWVDQATNLPARFQVWAGDESGDQKLICTITCDYNENYPDSMFAPGGVEKP
jgi:hypothetical protein